MFQHEHEDRCIAQLGQPFPEVHNYIDQYFFRYKSYSHRVILHHAMGIAHLRRRLGDYSKSSAELHVIDDIGALPTSPFYFFCDPNFDPTNVECIMLEKDCRRVLNLNIDFETIYYGLPEFSGGYKSKQLLELYGLMSTTRRLDASEDMILAMHDLLRRYRIAPVFQL